MKNNIRSTDHSVRSVGGALKLGTTTGAVALLIGSVILGTTLTRTCLPYRILDVNTSA